MVESGENKLVESIVWSNNEFSLEDFVTQYELPQVVRVEVGYFGDNERTTLSGGQLLTLHELRKTTKVICEAALHNVVVVSLLCPLKVHVYPSLKDCKHATITTDQMASMYAGSIKYLRVLTRHCNDECSEETCEAGDVLKVKSVDHTKRVLKCTNVATSETVVVPFDSTALFAPLLDDREYTLAEVKKKFGFPARVRFLDAKTEGKLRPKGGTSSMSVSSLGEVTVLEEFEETVVISTTISGNMKKICFQLPIDLDITIAVAEGFMEGTGGETYQRLVRTLDKGFNRTKLDAFEHLDVYQHVDAVKNEIQNMSKDVSAEQAPDNIKNRLSELRAKALFGDDTPPPPIPRRKPIKSVGSSETLPLPPKLAPKPPPKAKPSPKITDKLKGLSLPKQLMSPFKRQQSDGTGAQTESPRRNKSDSEYTYVETIKSNSDDDDDAADGRYTSIDPNYIASDDHVYEKPQFAKPNTQPRYPPKPNIPPPAVPMTDPPKSPTPEHDEIYQAIARIPKDISRLSVKDVGKLLTNLGMGCYVEMFERELVDGEMLQNMDQASLESLDVKLFHIKKLLKFIGGWRPKQ